MAKAKLPKLSKSSLAKRLKNVEQVNTTLDLAQIAALDALAKRLERTKASLAREAFDDLLAKHGKKGAK